MLSAEHRLNSMTWCFHSSLSGQVNYLWELGAGQVPKHEGVRCMCHQVPVISHDLHLINLIAIERLENDPCACGQVFDNDLAQTHICHLKFILVDRPPQTAVKLFHSTTQRALDSAGQINLFISAVYAQLYLKIEEWRCKKKENQNYCIECYMILATIMLFFWKHQYYRSSNSYFT